MGFFEESWDDLMAENFLILIQEDYCHDNDEIKDIVKIEADSNQIYTDSK